jgi:mono/diheme cytochrome c family protein
MDRAAPVLLLSLATLGTATAFAAVDFQNEIAPIFAEHCLECHGPEKVKGGLNLTTHDGILKELKSGNIAVIAGKPEASALIERLLSSDEDEVMPPRKKEKRPKPEEIARLKTWIAEGAPWAEHWSYRPVRRPASPPVKSPAWTRNEIDAFVLSGLEARGITPSPEADRPTLIKRVQYDLLGLPPTPAEVDAFAADMSPDAYEKIVDRALASPHFGERWGRHWLDKARYADSDGYEKDTERLDAWRYRDWVIAAVNRDQPFDQFTIEQLAGDLLPDATAEQRLATAFHRQTLTNREGGVDQEQYRVEAVFDRAETTGSVWLGLTVGCARCHTHKYDLITQHEYYQLFAFFNNADETTTKIGISAEALAEYEKANAARVAELKRLQERVTATRAALSERFPEWERIMQARAAALKDRKASQQLLAVTGAISEGKAVLTAQPDDSWLASGPQAKHDRYVITADLPAAVVSGARLEVFPDDSLPGKGPGRSERGNFVLSEIAVNAGARAVTLHSAVADFSQNGWLAAQAIDGNPDTGWAIAPEFGKPHWIEIQFAEPIDGTKVHEVTISLAQTYPNGQHGIGRFRVQALVGESEDALAPEQIRRLVRVGSEKWTAPDREVLLDWIARTDAPARAAAEALALAEASGPKAPLMDARVIAQRTKNPRLTKVLDRGEFLRPSDPVQAGGLAILPPIQARSGVEPDRLDLARWLVSRENPLTARVTVNDIWLHLFGEGLVRTPGDFGVRGERPTHPELLDWLADEFMARGWSRKSLIRLIVTSATYRQSSAVRHDLREVDHQNRLLARQNRIRVEAEIVRDLQLAASGLLARKVGGPSVYPPLPPEVAAISYDNNFKWKTSVGDDLYRRGLYTFFKRTAPYPDLMVFDCPDANVSAIRRGVSNTPLQALTTLNGQVYTEAARALAERAIAATGDDATRITFAFRHCLGREPSSVERELLISLLEKGRAVFAEEPESAVKFIAASGGKSPAQDQPAPADLAAWIATMRILLNTDELITRD